MVFFADGGVYSSDGTQLFLAQVLLFFTGVETVPTLGFQEPFKVHFLAEEEQLATASTCDLLLRIPICHETYEKFEQSLVLSILGSVNFYRP